jgi:hypothetical protein
MGIPNTVANGACVKELGRTSRKEKVMERVLDIGKDCGKWMKRAEWEMH